ncbi:hypothetical protein CVT24_000774 [Panaeolus cyanescens]|uniref:DNA-directed RNA polymerase RBP11-like dimerisation domain-containing protein n=1 Tax=Panaeolus cyanescens TaxID=181874 RepID=A0A409YCL8_9AGAR|nr:hypothetical protein CVT24_000774 [Panaeolus cyanescens]
MNAPPRHELYVLEDGEKPVEITEDTKIPNAATIKIVKQDHTLANMLRAQLLAMPQTLFAGYKVPHPLHPYFLIKIQTDGTITPQDLLEQACKKLIATMVTLESKFTREFSYKDVESTTGVTANTGLDDPYGTGAGGAAYGRGKDYLDF